MRFRIQVRIIGGADEMQAGAIVVDAWLGEKDVRRGGADGMRKRRLGCS